MRTYIVEKEMGGFLQETSLFSMGLVMKKNVASDFKYVLQELTVRWLLKILKPSMIQGSKLGK